MVRVAAEEAESRAFPVVLRAGVTSRYAVAGPGRVRQNKNARPCRRKRKDKKGGKGREAGETLHAKVENTLLGRQVTKVEWNTTWYQISCQVIKV